MTRAESTALIEAIEEYFKTEKRPSAKAIAERLGLDVTLVYNRVNRLRAEGRIPTARKIVKLVDYDEKVARFYKDNPSATVRDCMLEFGLNHSQVLKIRGRLSKKGLVERIQPIRTNGLPSVDQINKYLDHHPFATFKHVASYFGGDVNRLNEFFRQCVYDGSVVVPSAGHFRSYITKEHARKIENLIDSGIFPTSIRVANELQCSEGVAYALLNEYERLVNPIKNREQKKSGDYWIATVDDELEKKVTIRDAWYVAEVTEKGFPGMRLPRDMWARYLAIYKKKRLGLIP